MHAGTPGIAGASAAVGSSFRRPGHAQQTPQRVGSKDALLAKGSTGGPTSNSKAVLAQSGKRYSVRVIPKRGPGSTMGHDNSRRQPSSGGGWAQLTGSGSTKSTRSHPGSPGGHPVSGVFPAQGSSGNALLDLEIAEARKQAEGNWRNYFSMRRKSVVDTSDAMVIIEETRTCTVNLQAQRWRYWDMALIICVAITATFTPFEVAFMDFNDPVPVVVNRIIDVIFVCDTILQFFVPFEDATGNTITNNCDIAKHYARGWLLVDLVSLFPFDLLAESNDDVLGKLTLLRSLRLLRLFKLLRILRASRVINRWRNQIGISNAISSLVRFLIMFMLIMHWGACMWFMAATLSAQDDSGELPGTWVSEAGLSQAGAGSRYLASVYFAASTSSTVGYGDISAVTDAERGVSLLLMLMGGGLYAFMVGSVQTIIASMDEAKQQFDADSDNLNLFMASVSLPTSLRVEIREFFDQTLHVHRERYYRDILRKLSPMLRKRVAAHCHMAWVTAVPFLACRDEEEMSEFAASVAVRMRAEAFAPFELILRPGHINRRLFVIQKGLAVRRGAGRVIGVGTWFGEEMILTRGRVLHEGVSSITLTLCTTLHRDDLAAVLESGHFERTRRTLRKAVVRLALRQEFVRCARLAQLHARKAKLRSAGAALGKFGVTKKALSAVVSAADAFTTDPSSKKKPHPPPPPRDIIKAGAGKAVQPTRIAVNPGPGMAGADNTGAGDVSARSDSTAERDVTNGQQFVQAARGAKISPQFGAAAPKTEPGSSSNSSSSRWGGVTELGGQLKMTAFGSAESGDEKHAVTIVGGKASRGQAPSDWDASHSASESPKGQRRAIPASTTPSRGSDATSTSPSRNAPGPPARHTTAAAQRQSQDGGGAVTRPSRDSLDVTDGAGSAQSGDGAGSLEDRGMGGGDVGLGVNPHRQRGAGGGVALPMAGARAAVKSGGGNPLGMIGGSIPFSSSAAAADDSSSVASGSIGPTGGSFSQPHDRSRRGKSLRPGRMARHDSNEMSRLRRELDGSGAPLLARVMTRAALVQANGPGAAGSGTGSDGTSASLDRIAASQALGIPDPDQIVKKDLARNIRDAKMRAANRELLRLMDAAASPVEDLLDDDGDDDDEASGRGREARTTPTTRQAPALPFGSAFGSSSMGAIAEEEPSHMDDGMEGVAAGSGVEEADSAYTDLHSDGDGYSFSGGAAAASDMDSAASPGQKNTTRRRMSVTAGGNVEGGGLGRHRRLSEGSRGTSYRGQDGFLGMQRSSSMSPTVSGRGLLSGAAIGGVGSGGAGGARLSMEDLQAVALAAAAGMAAILSSGAGMEFAAGRGGHSGSPPHSESSSSVLAQLLVPGRKAVETFVSHAQQQDGQKLPQERVVGGVLTGQHSAASSQTAGRGGLSLLASAGTTSTLGGAHSFDPRSHDSPTMLQLLSQARREDAEADRSLVHSARHGRGTPDTGRHTPGALDHGGSGFNSSRMGGDGTGAGTGTGGGGSMSGGFAMGESGLGGAAGGGTRSRGLGLATPSTANAGFFAGSDNVSTSLSPGTQQQPPLTAASMQVVTGARAGNGRWHNPSGAAPMALHAESSGSSDSDMTGTSEPTDAAGAAGAGPGVGATLLTGQSEGGPDTVEMQRQGSGVIQSTATPSAVLLAAASTAAAATASGAVASATSASSVAAPNVSSTGEHPKASGRSNASRARRASLGFRQKPLLVARRHSAMGMPANEQLQELGDAPLSLAGMMREAQTEVSAEGGPGMSQAQLTSAGTSDGAESMRHLPMHHHQNPAAAAAAAAGMLLSPAAAAAMLSNAAGSENGLLAVSAAAGGPSASTGGGVSGDVSMTAAVGGGGALASTDMQNGRVGGATGGGRGIPVISLDVLQHVVATATAAQFGALSNALEHSIRAARSAERQASSAKARAEAAVYSQERVLEEMRGVRSTLHELLTSQRAAATTSSKRALVSASPGAAVADVTSVAAAVVAWRNRTWLAVSFSLLMAVIAVISVIVLLVRPTTA